MRGIGIHCEERSFFLSAGAGSGMAQHRAVGCTYATQMDTSSVEDDDYHPHSRGQVIPMGDKSPKAKDKSKKQGTADKNQKKAAAAGKANPPSLGAKKGK